VTCDNPKPYLNGNWTYFSVLIFILVQRHVIFNMFHLRPTNAVIRRESLLKELDRFSTASVKFCVV